MIMIGTETGDYVQDLPSSGKVGTGTTQLVHLVYADVPERLKFVLAPGLGHVPGMI